MAATAQMIHKFEDAGLGRAPYTYVREVDRGRNNPGSCNYCGTAIRYEQVIEDASGKRFVVGSDCICKSGDEGLIPFVTEAEKQRRWAKAAAAEEVRLQKRRAEHEAQLSAEREKNGGLTDEELAEQNYAAKLAAIKAENAAIIEGIYNDGDYAAGWIRTLEVTRIADMSDNQIWYLSDLYAKQRGRRNSKAFNAAWEEISTMIDAICEAAN